MARMRRDGDGDGDCGYCRCSAVESWTLAVAAALLWSHGLMETTARMRRRDGDEMVTTRRGCSVAVNALLWSHGLWLRRRADRWASRRDGGGETVTAGETEQRRREASSSILPPSSRGQALLTALYIREHEVGALSLARSLSLKAIMEAGRRLTSPPPSIHPPKTHATITFSFSAICELLGKLLRFCSMKNPRRYMGFGGLELRSAGGGISQRNVVEKASGWRWLLEYLKARVRT
ncbi:hypothetical protein ACLOJK_035033 [Asimina triloba]